MPNNALSVNPNVANVDMSTAGSSFLWAIFCCMFSGAVGLLAWSFFRPQGQRAFHHLSSMICFTASIAYFALASNLGGTPVLIEYIRGGTLGQNWVDVGVLNPTRAVFYARYIDWTITTPLLLLELLLTTGLPLTEIFSTIFMDELMIITGLIGALVASEYKWGFFAFGCAAEVYIGYVLLGPARASAARLGPEFSKAYIVSALILSSLWVGYPVCWILSEGGNVITPTGEAVFYGILDVLAKPVFCAIHCYAIADCDYARLGFSSGKYSETSTTEEHSFFNSTGHFIEKSGNGNESVTSTSAEHAAVPVKAVV